MKTKDLMIWFALIVLVFASLASVQAASDADARVININASNSCLKKDIPIQVTNYKGQPIKDAKVTITCRSKKTDYGMTDENGLFVYKALNTKEGANEILVRKDGFADASMIINISSQCVMSTTSTTLDTTTTTQEATTTSTTITTTTTTLPCNYDGICDIAFGENYNFCPGECAGAADGVCDRRQDWICDPDCGRSSDVDCYCNRDGVCEPQFESYDNCAADCRKGEKDGYCDRTVDGVCDQDCGEGEDSDCKSFDFAVLILPVILIIVGFGAFAALNVKRQKKLRDAENLRDDLIESLKKRLKDGEDPAVLKKELLDGGLDAKLLDDAEKRIWE